MNNVILLGRLVADANLRYTQGGSAVCTFTLAVDRGLSRQKKQEAEAQGKPTADFIRITVWGVQGENASKYLHKGSQCAVQGRIQTGSYKDNDGKTVYTTDIVAESVEFLSKSTQEESKSNSGVNTHRGNQNHSNGFFEDDFSEIEDDGRLPF